MPQLTGGGFPGQGLEGRVNYIFRTRNIYRHFFVFLYDNYESIEKTKEDMKSIKITDLNGENVIDFRIRVPALAELMDKTGACDF